jgi:hypothetical protein
MKTIAQFPAYDVIDLELDVIEMSREIANGLTFCVAYESRNHGTLHSRVHPYCADYYEREAGGGDAEVKEAIEAMEKNGHDIFWISNLATTITSSNREREAWHILRDGQKIRMAGQLLEIKKLPQGDIYYELVPVNQ